MTSIYDKALNAVNGNKVNAELHSGSRKHVFLKQSNGAVNLVYQKRDRNNLVRKVEQVKCAVYMPNRGWIFTLSKEAYAAWVERTGHKIENKPVAPRLMCVELRREWRLNGGI